MRIIWARRYNGTVEDIDISKVIIPKNKSRYKALKDISEQLAESSGIPEHEIVIKYDP